ncbi:hypothetical protein KS4_21920 [Poriferisphaera corsica]|uniref:Uncharacterized protein n=1 Tax=Poriferisphaera corsica TaxID=2528020 RepID=A0A517YV79_9BACT|nr:hypothetical protein [Poriferisphaera corsica]QDU34130.1 hypothetical protein KS4_21920 [Poriferisphaera corsica]
MGWGRTLLLGDIGNRMDIADTERDINLLKNKLSRQSSAMNEIAQLKDTLKNQSAVDHSQDKMLYRLHQENAELKLYLASLIRLLSSKGLISEEELQAMVEQIDASDGEADGRFEGDVI